MGISVAGGVFHNVGQLIVAMLCGGDIQCRLLFPGASGRRTDYRTGDRDRVGGKC